MDESLVKFSIVIVAISFGGLIALVAIVSEAMRRSSQVRQVEQTKRELAAYVAEGSMTADEAYRLLSAKPVKREKESI